MYIYIIAILLLVLLLFVIIMLSQTTTTIIDISAYGKTTKRTATVYSTTTAALFTRATS